MKKYLLAGAIVVLSSPAFSQDTGAVFAALDTNHDNMISPDEAKANTLVVKVFSQADNDRDGFLTRAEFDAAFGK
ncbi:MAG: hypothetical protein ABIP64_12170 [Burkholderiales bacterium]